MKVHFIAIGGSAMHNLAIALHKKGYSVTGSDDEILDPSKSRLERYGLLPEYIGWESSKITSELDAIILGMHAREDNPELYKAKQLGLKIYSYPEYIYEQTKDKIRVVIGGSHGKTSITSMILHVLNYHNIENDYMVGAQLEGFECMVSLSKTAKIAILEGDEYLSSPIDRRPKFHLYKPHIALISGIAWDHINVFPTYEIYLEQFKIFIELIEKNGKLIYCAEDIEVKKLAEHQNKIQILPYKAHAHNLRKGKTFLKFDSEEVEINVFGQHNLQNLSGALEVCKALGVSEQMFYSAITCFNGASKRLETVVEKDDFIMYKDFAHSPSKLKATTSAVKNQFPERELVAAMELHTFSSLNKTFLKLYEGSMCSADIALIYFNPATIEHKKLDPVSVEDVSKAFNSDNIIVFTDSNTLLNKLYELDWSQKNLLMMSSGNFDGIDFTELGKKLSS